METIRSFEDMVVHLAQRGGRKRVAIVWAADQYSQESVIRALQVGFIDAIFVGCQKEVEGNLRLMKYESHIEFVEAADRDEAARISVKMVREGRADILMKGLINTDNLLHVVLDKETGILPRGNVLTHITASQLPEYDKMLFFTDSAVIPYPTQEQRIQQIRYMVYVCHALGIEEPKISLIHCTEKVNEKYFPFTLGYKEIIKMAENGDFGRCIIDGPLDLKTSVSPESMRIKGINSPIGGEADALIFPDIEAANVFYKSITLFLGVETAGVLQGTMAPVVLPSRSDSKLCKFYSLALAAI
ncbi:MAG: phosphate butyryltransferase [Prevotella sp.]|jgi:phosphate butyryltransferase|nr:phosphate butyryltransferase [Prevotella sp.]